MISFDPTITFGAILNAAALLGGFVVAFTRLGGRIDLLGVRIETMEEALRDHKDFEKRLTIVEERMTNHGTMISTCQADISSIRRAK